MVEAEEDPRIRARADAMRAEIELLRGAVSALRATRRSTRPPPLAHARADDARLALAAAIAFGLGIAVTAFVVILYRVALCP